MKKLLFVLSVILNIVLIAAVVVAHRSVKRTTFRTIADATAAEVRLQEHILTELDSGDAERVGKMKDLLKQNIENGKQAAVRWQSASQW